VAILVSRYNELVTAKLLDGAHAACADAGIAREQVDVIWVPGAFELPAVAAATAASGRYACLVALGAVIRGETAHFEFVAGEATRGLGEVALRHLLPVGFGVLTVDTMEQALARAGGGKRHSGEDAAHAVLRMAELRTELGTRN
jgi:6,7-dimethyl-8-ribityllumazine synthase